MLGIELYVDVGRFHRRKLCERLILSETPGSAGSGAGRERSLEKVIPQRVVA